jgi:CheY-like chemotaxis protein
VRSTSAPAVVLVVEDEPILRATIAHELRRAGCEVVESGTAEQAIAHARDGRRIDVVFTDIQLPGRLNGWDVAEQFRAVDADVTVIYTSGNSADRSRRVADSLFFAKPYDAAAVVLACRPHGA